MDSRVLPSTSRGSAVRRLGDQAHLRYVRLLQQDQRADDRPVVNAVVTAHKHRLARLAALYRRNTLHQHFAIDRLLRIIADIQVQVPAGIHGHHQWFLVLVIHRPGLRLGQIDLHPLGQQRCGDHENHQHHQHDVDVRDDVDLGHGFLADELACHLIGRRPV